MTYPISHVRVLPAPPQDEDECMVCGHQPCTCDEQYDAWKERDL